MENQKIINKNSNFLTTTDNYFQFSPNTKLDFSLNSGRLFKDPVNITSSNNSNILINENTNPRFVTIQEFKGSSFTKIDSIENRIVKSAGDFNSNGKTDLLSLFTRNGYIDEQTQPLSSAFMNKSADSSGAFWPILADDIDDDGFTEVLVIESDSAVNVFQLDNNLTPIFEDKLVNFSNVGLFGNYLETPNAVVTDADNNGVKELWMVDSDGDIISFNINGPNNYSANTVFETQFIGSENILTAGDFDNDNREEIAVLLQSSQDLDIAPFNLLLIFNLQMSIPIRVMN